MMKKIVSFLLLSIPILLWAQKYQDAAAFGLIGNVRECQVTSGEYDPYGFTHLTFNRDGQLEKYNGKTPLSLKHDNDGYLVSIKFENSKSLLGYESLYFEYKNGKMTNHDSYVYQYNKDGDLVRQTDTNELRASFGHSALNRTIKIKQKDFHGNYLVIEYEKPQTIVVKRSITYWDDDTNSQEGQYSVTAERLNIRSVPSSQGRNIGQLTKGSIIRVEGIQAGWAKIQYKGGIGYVSARYIAKASEGSVSKKEELPQMIDQPSQNHNMYQANNPRTSMKAKQPLLWNFKGGLMSRTIEKSATETASSTDWLLGIEAEIPLSVKWNIEAGLRYKSTYRIYQLSGYRPEYENGKAIGLLEIPVRLTYKYPLTKDFCLHAGIGPYVSNDLFANATDTQVGLEPSAVLYWKNFNIGFHYDLPIYKSSNSGKDCYTSNAIMLTLGIRFKSKVWKYIGIGAAAVGSAAAGYYIVTQSQDGQSQPIAADGEDSSASGTKAKSRRQCHSCGGTGVCSSSSHTADKYYCHGRKVCGWCNGSKYVTSYGQNVTCTGCKGSGICGYCNGSGRCRKCNGSGYK